MVLGLAPVGPSENPPDTVNAVKPGSGVAMFRTPRLLASKKGTYPLLMSELLYVARKELTVFDPSRYVSPRTSECTVSSIGPLAYASTLLASLSGFDVRR